MDWREWFREDEGLAIGVAAADSFSKPKIESRQFPKAGKGEADCSGMPEGKADKPGDRLRIG